MSQRRVQTPRRNPSFFWQGVFILAPMLVLAKVGALAIWQDKRVAEHEANLRAQDLAEQVAEKLAFDWKAHPPAEDDEVRVSTSGMLMEPKEIIAITLNRNGLGAEQERLWQLARTAEFAGTNRAQAIALFNQLLETVPPPPWAQQVRYALGLLYARDGVAAKAVPQFQKVVDDPAPAFGEIGGDLKTLSLLKLALLNGSGFERVCSNAVTQPTPLTPQTLRHIFEKGPANARNSAQAWWDVWQRDELKRRLWNMVRENFPANPPSIRQAGTTNLPHLFVGEAKPFRQNDFSAANHIEIATAAPGQLVEFKSPPTERSWLEEIDTTEFSTGIEGRVRRAPTHTGRVDYARLVEWQPLVDGYGVRFWTSVTLARWVSERMEKLRLPQYFGVSVSLAGRDVVRPLDLPSVVATGGGKGAGRHWVETTRGTNAAPAPLATASRINANAPSLLARVHLIGPDLLFEQQNSRRLWFQMVIAVAALISILGFISAYRAFHKQLRLAELKSNFVSSVSHELRAPIASVRLMAEGLERGKIIEPAKQREYFRFITQECRRLSSMIENVLDFARIEQGRKEYEFEPTEVRALVEQTVKLMEPYAAERGVRLALNVPPASCREELSENPASFVESSGTGKSEAPTRQDAGGTLAANIDGLAIQQALVNLIDNAIKHSPAGSEVNVNLEISDSQSSVLNSHFLLSVADQGPGIPAAEHEKIFERFYRLGSELRRETPGVGIGLSIVKHVVEAHDGHVRVESEVGKGSCFMIELPLNVSPTSCREETSEKPASLAGSSAGTPETRPRLDAGGTS